MYNADFVKQMKGKEKRIDYSGSNLNGKRLGQMTADEFEEALKKIASIIPENGQFSWETT
jgi:hypothetical protein